MIPTITQNLALYHMHRARNINLRAAVRFFETRLKQLRRAARRKRLQIISLRIKQLFARVIRAIRGLILFAIAFTAYALLTVLSIHTKK